MIKYDSKKNYVKTSYVIESLPAPQDHSLSMNTQGHNLSCKQHQYLPAPPGHSLLYEHLLHSYLHQLLPPPQGHSLSYEHLLATCINLPALQGHSLSYEHWLSRSSWYASITHFSITLRSLSSKTTFWKVRRKAIIVV